MGRRSIAWALCAALALAACGSDTDDSTKSADEQPAPNAGWCDRISTEALAELIGLPVTAEAPVTLGDTITCNTESDAVHLGWQARPAEMSVREFAETYNTGPRELENTRVNDTTEAVIATVAGEDPTTAAALYLQIDDELVVVTATLARPVGASEPPLPATTLDFLVRMVAQDLVLTSPSSGAAGEGTESSTTDTTTEPTVPLAKFRRDVRASLSALTTVHADVTVGETTISGDYDYRRQPVTYHRTTVRAGQEEQEIALGKHTYTDAGVGFWSKSPRLEAAEQATDPVAEVERLLVQAQEVHDLGADVVDGVALRRYAVRVGAPPMPDVPDEEPRATPVAEVWLDDEHRVHRMSGAIGNDWKVAMATLTHGTSDDVIVFSKFDAPLTIERPSQLGPRLQ